MYFIFSVPIMTSTWWNPVSTTMIKKEWFLMWKRKLKMKTQCSTLHSRKIKNDFLKQKNVLNKNLLSVWRYLQTSLQNQDFPHLWALDKKELALSIYFFHDHIIGFFFNFDQIKQFWKNLNQNLKENRCQVMIPHLSILL